MADTTTEAPPIPKVLNDETARDFRYFRVLPNRVLHNPDRSQGQQELAGGGEVIEIAHPVVRDWLGGANQQWFKLEALAELPDDAQLTNILTRGLRKLIAEHDARATVRDLDPHDGRGAAGREIDPANASKLQHPELIAAKQRVQTLEDQARNDRNTIASLEQRLEKLEKASPSAKPTGPKGKRN